MNLFADRLRSLVELRKQQGVYRSEAELARRLGLLPRRFNHYTNGRSKIIEYSLLTQICEELKTHPNYLFGWSDDPDPRYTESVGKIAGLESQIAQMRQTLKAITKPKILPKNGG